MFASCFVYVKSPFLGFVTFIRIQKRLSDKTPAYEVLRKAFSSLDDFVRIIRGFASESSDKLKNAVDINEDGNINVTDLGYVKSNLGKDADSYAE